MTTLAEIRTTIRASSPAEWNVLAEGPTFLTMFATVSGGGDPPHLEHEEHRLRAVYRPDVSLGLAWGLPLDRLRRTFDDDRFADPAYFLVHVDALWNGMLIDRDVVAVVDGGRAALPLGRPVTVDSGQDRPEIIGQTVRPADVALARLIDALSGNHDFDRYLDDSGLVVLDD